MTWSARRAWYPRPSDNLPEDLVREARSQFRAAVKRRTGLTCVMGNHPPYVIDRNGWAVAFCEKGEKSVR